MWEHVKGVALTTLMLALIAGVVFGGAIFLLERSNKNFAQEYAGPWAAQSVVEVSSDQVAVLVKQGHPTVSLVVYQAAGAPAKLTLHQSYYLMSGRNPHTVVMVVDKEKKPGELLKSSYGFYLRNVADSVP